MKVKDQVRRRVPRKPVPMDKKHQDELLDEALKETFPASDPPAVQGSDIVEPEPTE